MFTDNRPTKTILEDRYQVIEAQLSYPVRQTSSEPVILIGGLCEDQLAMTGLQNYLVEAGVPSITYMVQEKDNLIHPVERKLHPEIFSAKALWKVMKHYDYAKYNLVPHSFGTFAAAHLSSEKAGRINSITTLAGAGLSKHMIQQAPFGVGDLYRNELEYFINDPVNELQYFWHGIFQIARQRVGIVSDSLAALAQDITKPLNNLKIRNPDLKLQAIQFNLDQLIRHQAVVEYGAKKVPFDKVLLHPNSKLGHNAPFHQPREVGEFLLEHLPG